MKKKKIFNEHPVLALSLTSQARLSSRPVTPAACPASISLYVIFLVEVVIIGEMGVTDGGLALDNIVFGTNKKCNPRYFPGCSTILALLHFYLIRPNESSIVQLKIALI